LASDLHREQDRREQPMTTDKNFHNNIVEVRNKDEEDRALKQMVEADHDNPRSPVCLKILAWLNLVLHNPAGGGRHEVLVIVSCESILTDDVPLQIQVHEWKQDRRDHR
jgi:hypothetical protein